MRRTLAPALVLAAATAASVGTAAAQSAGGKAALGEGEALLRSQRFADAAEKFAAAIASDPDWPLAHYDLAYAQRRAGRCADAVGTYRRYADLRPGEPDPFYGLGLCLRELGDDAGALAALERYVALERRPSEQRWVDKAHTQIEALRATLAPKTRADARAAATPAKEPAPTAGAKETAPAAPPKTIFKSAPPAPRGTETPKAETVTKAQAPEPTATEARPDGHGGAKPPTAPVVETPTSEKVGKTPALELTAAPATAVASPTPEAQAPAGAPVTPPATVRAPADLMAQGSAALAARRPEDAVAAFRQAARVAPADAEAQHQLGVALALCGQLSEAGAAWQEALRLDPRRDDSARSLDRLRKKLTADDRSGDVRAAAARVREHVRAGRWVQAEAEADRVLAEHPHAEATLVLRGRARLERGDPAAARADFLHALAGKPDDAEALRGVADSYLAQSQNERAAYYLDLFAAATRDEAAARRAERQARDLRR